MCVEDGTKGEEGDVCAGQDCLREIGCNRSAEEDDEDGQEGRGDAKSQKSGEDGWLSRKRSVIERFGT